MPARNAGIGDCSAAHPSISARLRVCVSTVHVLPRARTRHTKPNGLHANGHRVSLARCQPCPRARCPCLSRIPFFFCLWLAKSETLTILPKLCPRKSPKRTQPDRGSLALKLFTLLCRDKVSSLLHLPQAIDGVQTSGTRSPKGKPALASGAGCVEAKRATNTEATPAPRLDLRFPLQRSGGNWKSDSNPGTD